MDSQFLEIESDVNRDFERLCLERRRLVEKRLDLVAELRSVTRIRTYYFHVVRMRCETGGGNISLVQRSREASYGFHRLFEDIQSDIRETRLELEHNQAELKALRQNARQF